MAEEQRRRDEALRLQEEKEAQEKAKAEQEESLRLQKQVCSLSTPLWPKRAGMSGLSVGERKSFKMRCHRLSNTTLTIMNHRCMYPVSLHHFLFTLPLQQPRLLQTFSRVTYLTCSPHNCQHKHPRIQPSKLHIITMRQEQQRFCTVPNPMVCRPLVVSHRKALLVNSMIIRRPKYCILF